MNANEFVQALKDVVQYSSVDDTIKNLIDPPGRNPSQDILQISKFYHSLNEGQKNDLNSVLQLVAETTLFGMLCVLDGVRAIEDGEDKGELKLYFVKDGKSELLNNFDEEFLHDLL